MSALSALGQKIAEPTGITQIFLPTNVSALCRHLAKMSALIPLRPLMLGNATGFRRDVRGLAIHAPNALLGPAGTRKLQQW